MATSPRYAITLLANNAGNVASVNEALRIVEAFLGGARVKDRDLLTPPGSPADGDLYLLPSSGTLTGAWATFANGSLALYANTAWLEIVVDAAMEGCTIRVVDEEVVLVYADEDGWVETQVSVSTAQSGTGTTQGGATSISRQFAEFTTVTGSNNAAVLPAARAGARHVVKNADAADALQIFPASGDQIDALGTNAAYSLAAGKIVTLWAIDATQWYAMLGA